MANCSLDMAYANQEECFAVAETVCGTLKKPGAGDRVFTVGPIDFGQELELLEDEQIRASASKLPSVKGRLLPGDFSFTTYVKPSGTLAAAPEAGMLFKALLGNETVTSDVQYTLADQLDSLSFWFKKGHTVFALRGATLESAEFNITGDAIATIRWSGKFMERLWAGEVIANDTCNVGKETIILAPTGALRYFVGMYVKVGTDDNTGAGYLLTDVNYTNNTITISPTLVTNQGVNPTIYPHFFTAGAEVGAPEHGKLGLVTVGGHDAVVLSANVTLTNNIKYYADEKNNVWTAEKFGRPGRRAIEGNLSLYFLKQGASYFYKAGWKQSNALVIPVGNVAGKIMELSIPYAEYRAPTISGTEEFIEEVPFVAVASPSLNDEFKVTFK